MAKNTTIMSFDLGAKCAAATLGADGIKTWATTLKTYTDFYEFSEGLIEKKKPEIIVIGQAVRFYNAIVKLNRYAGILMLLAERYNIAVVEINDKQARKVVFGRDAGKASAHRESRKLYDLKGKTPDEIDATIFCVAWQRMSRESETDKAKREYKDLFTVD